MMAERPAGISQPWKGQKWTRSPVRWRMKRSQGMPAWVDFATEPLHVEMKDGLGGSSALFRQPSPARIAGARFTNVGGDQSSVEAPASAGTR